MNQSIPTPGTFITLNAYNLWEGATFLRDGGRVWTVHEFRDFGANERVLVIAHRADSEDSVEEADEMPFVWDYMTKVHVIGNVRKPHDFDDNDWGT